MKTPASLASAATLAVLTASASMPLALATACRSEPRVSNDVEITAAQVPGGSRPHAREVAADAQLHAVERAGGAAEPSDSDPERAAYAAKIQRTLDERRAAVDDLQRRASAAKGPSHDEDDRMLHQIDLRRADLSEDLARVRTIAAGDPGWPRVREMIDRDLASYTRAIDTAVARMSRPSTSPATEPGHPNAPAIPVTTPSVPPSPPEILP